MSKPAEYPDCNAIFPPVPVTKRGFGLHVDTLKTSKGKFMLYCNGTHVFVRNLEDRKDVSIYSGHKSKVNIARFSPNGEWIASGDDEGRVHVWGTRSKVQKNDVWACRRVLDISWADDGKRIAACGDGTEQLAKVFPWDSSSNLGQISGHNKVILGITFKPGRPYRIFTCSEDRSVNFYQGPPFKFTSSYKGHSRYPNSVKYSPDGTMAVTAGADGKIVVFDGKTGEVIREFAAHGKSNIYALAWGPDSKEILTGSADKTVRIHNVEDGSELQTFTFGATVGDQQVSTFWCDNILGSISLDGTINFLDRETNSVSHKWFGHKSPVTALAVCKAARQIFSGDQEGYLLQWDEKTGDAKKFCGAGHGTKAVCSLGVSCDGKQLVSVGHDDRLLVSNIDGHSFSEEGCDLGGQAAAMAVGNKTADLALVVLHKQQLLIFKGGNIEKKVELPFVPTTIALSPDDKEVAIGSREPGLRPGVEHGTVYMYDMDGDFSSPVRKLPSHEHPISSVSYSVDSKNFMSTDENRYIYVWDREGTYEKARQTGWRFHSAKPTCCDWNPDSERAVTGSMDQSLIVWKKASTGKSRRQELDPTHLGGTYAVRWMDEATLVTTGHDRTVKVWPFSS